MRNAVLSLVGIRRVVDWHRRARRVVDDMAELMCLNAYLFGFIQVVQDRNEARNWIPLAEEAWLGTGWKRVSHLAGSETGQDTRQFLPGPLYGRIVLLPEVRGFDPDRRLREGAFLIHEQRLGMQGCPAPLRRLPPRTERGSLLRKRFCRLCTRLHCRGAQRPAQP